MEEAEKMKCYKRLIYKQFFQVSGLCGPQFLSYLPKRLTHLCRALFGDAILVTSRADILRGSSRVPLFYFVLLCI